jgi:hypothetical protein
VSNRNNNSPDNRNNNLGFRLALQLKGDDGCQLIEPPAPLSANGGKYPSENCGK